ncbi:hypothetical protein [Nocardia beijingensis]|uniref:hypothetical protein n=1 Tax=Nocardia beijingensis TaxID=95162 RepID=UPI0012F4E0D9|nr:hypothetical protein [Nocardia beijingensis]
MKFSFAAAFATAAVLCMPCLAAAEPNPADLEFTANSAYREYQNNIAKFTGQVNYSSNNFAWSLKLLPATQSVVYGNMSCRTTIGGISGYSDDHPDIPRDYLLHSSVKIDRGRWYKLRSRCDFKVLTDTGMQPGNVETAVDFIAR